MMFRLISASPLLLPLILFLGCESNSSVKADIGKPNILFISIDDLNDWIEPLGGHPQAKTPHLQDFANESVTFARNYCPSPGCNPSRSSTITGIHTYKSGMYSNYQDWRKAIKDYKTIGEYLRENGYYSAGAGKIFHYDQVAPECWDDYYPSQEKNMPDYYYPKPDTTVNMPVFKYMYSDFDWSPINLTDEETGDYKSVRYIMDQLQKKHEKPFFLACGIYRPHLPWYVPQKYFDMFPLESVQLPKILENDLDDLGERAQEIAVRGGNYHKHVIEAGQWKKAVQGYLASIAYADAMAGILLDALENSPYAKNTVIILWSDHGWQLGEKKHWRKFALWDNLARTVLMIKVPEGIAALPEGSKNGEVCNRVTSLIDIYPTIIDLTGLPRRNEHDGHSLVPLLQNPEAEWNYPALTTYDYWEFSVRTEDWRYIRYIDDSEELYDHRADPEEWRNLAYLPEYQNAKKELAKHIPANPAPLLKETLIPLMPHHFPPYISKEDYARKKSASRN
jgi:arylsulfatase A-like enzyme